MPPAPKRPAEDTTKPGSEKKKLVQTKLSFAPRTLPWSTIASSSSSSTPSASNRSSSSSSTPSSGRYTYSAPYTTPTSSRYFSNSSSPSSQRRSPAGRGGLFKNRQWVREDSGGSSSLSGLSLSDDAGDKRGLDGREETPRKLKPFGARYNAERAAVAKETIGLIPEVLKQVPEGKKWADLYCDPAVRLDASKCPGYTLPADDADAGKKGCRIKVVNGDTFDTAIGMGKVIGETKGVVVLNMANARHPGGGWRKGAMAQEEELCYRSTLWRTLHKSFYPLPEVSGVYSPSVIVFRSTVATGHVLYSTGKPFNNLSVISVAALRDPPLTDTTPPDFKLAGDKNVTLDKIRMILRIAALEGHSRLVLGALGCGAFNNPREKVVECFLQVFGEPEFRGGWWKEVVFAVMDMEKEDNMKGVKGDGNLGVFWRGLNGVRV